MKSTAIPREQEERTGTGRPRGSSVLVTGANTGIGRAIALAFGDRDMNVAINYVTGRDEAESVVREIQKRGGNAVAIRADISRESQVKGMFGRIFEEFGTLDILINNAGIQRDAQLADMSLADWQKVIDVNLTGSFLCSREAVKEFLRRGDHSYGCPCIGKIIFISSVHDVIPWAGHCNYAASKGGELLLMRSMAQELGPKMIRVNSIAPGAVKTSINKSEWESPEARAKLIELIPYQRIGTPADIARVAVWLASDDSDYVHGETIYVDGGMTLYPAFARGG